MIERNEGNNTQIYPEVVTELIAKGYQLSKIVYPSSGGYGTRLVDKSFLCLSRVPLSDFLTTFGSRGEAVHVEVFTGYRGLNESGNLIGTAVSHPQYVFTDGAMTNPLPPYKGGIPYGRFTLQDANYVGWMGKNIILKEGRGFSYHMQTNYKTPQIRSIIKELGANSLNFTFTRYPGIHKA